MTRKFIKNRCIYIFLALCFLCPAPASPFCFDEAGQEYGISPLLLEGIARHESDLNPLVIHYNSNGTYDFGLMQINSSWYETLGPELWAALGDPCTNVKVGAWILSDCISRLGYTWEAIGCYNARDPVKRWTYVKKVQSKLAKLTKRRK